MYIKDFNFSCLGKQQKGIWNRKHVREAVVLLQLKKVRPFRQGNVQKLHFTPEQEAI